MFAIDNRVGADLGDTVKLAIRYMPLTGPNRVLMITGGSGRVYLDPAWWEASLGFIRLGIEHILSGIDHMLFLLCLVIPFRRIKPLIPVITAFTLGHSITLIGTAYNLAPLGAWFPPFVEAAIAATIFYMAIENIVGANLRRRWIIAALFGLVHELGSPTSSGSSCSLPARICPCRWCLSTSGSRSASSWSYVCSSPPWRCCFAVLWPVAWGLLCCRRSSPMLPGNG